MTTSISRPFFAAVGTIAARLAAAGRCDKC